MRDAGGRGRSGDARGIGRSGIDAYVRMDVIGWPPMKGRGVVSLAIASTATSFQGVPPTSTALDTNTEKSWHLHSIA